jgi:hypothetical protein
MTTSPFFSSSSISFMLFCWSFFPVSSLNIYYKDATRTRIFKLLRSPRIDSKESIPPAYVAWWAGTTTLSLLGA